MATAGVVLITVDKSPLAREELIAPTGGFFGRPKRAAEPGDVPVSRSPADDISPRSMTRAGEPERLVRRITPVEVRPRADEHTSAGHGRRERDEHGRYDSEVTRFTRSGSANAPSGAALLPDREVADALGAMSEGRRDCAVETTGCLSAVLKRESGLLNTAFPCRSQEHRRRRRLGALALARNRYECRRCAETRPSRGS